MSHPNTPIPYAQHLRISRIIVLLSFFAFLIEFCASIVWFPVPSQMHNSFDTRLTVCLFFVSPLLVFLPGVLLKKYRSHIWLCFLLMLYFCRAVMNLFSDEVRLLDWIDLALILILFSAAMLYARWQGRMLVALRDNLQGDTLAELVEDVKNK